MGDSTETHIQLIHSLDRGLHWSKPVRVDSGDLRSNVMPALAVGAMGGADLSWYGSPSPDFTDSRAEWVEEFAQTSNGLSTTPIFTQTQVSEGGPVHIGSVDSSGNPGSNLYDWDLRDFQAIAIDGCGTAHLVWTDDTGPGATAVATQTSGPGLSQTGCESRVAASPASGRRAAPQSPQQPRVGAQKKARSLPATGVGDIWFGWLLIAAAATSAAWLVATSRTLCRSQASSRAGPSMNAVA